MKYINSILIVILMFVITGCPLMDLPPALAPLKQTKTSNTDYKITLKLCRLLNDGETSYSYDDAGRLIGQSTNPATQMKYDQNGFLKEVDYDFGFTGVLFFEYKDNLLSNVSRITKDAGFRRENKYSNGVYQSQGLLSNTNNAVLSSYSANGQGQVTSTSVGETFEYDSRGNCIKQTGPSGTTLYEYDNRVNPVYRVYNYLKGQGSPFNPSVRTLIQGSSIVSTAFPNNLTKIITPTRTFTYTYTYNANNLPQTKKDDSSGETITYVYENCN
jgi:YD repeat-containing protein